MNDIVLDATKYGMTVLSYWEVEFKFYGNTSIPVGYDISYSCAWRLVDHEQCKNFFETREEAVAYASSVLSRQKDILENAMIEIDKNI